MGRPEHVDLKKLRELVASVELNDQKANEYINARWLKYIEWWDWRARSSKRKYQALRSAVVVGSALLPAIVALREVQQLSKYAWIFAVASIAVSLIVAVCGGLEVLFGFGDIWREKRKALELIQSEGFCFFELTGPYSNFTSHQAAYKLFTQNVEDLIRREINDYMLAVTPKKDKDQSGGDKPGK